jgi:hypothetical protein
MDDTAASKMDEVRRFLDESGLGRYAAQFDEEGYDELKLLLSLSSAEYDELVEAVAMKPGHALKFRRRLEATGGVISPMRVRPERWSGPLSPERSLRPFSAGELSLTGPIDKSPERPAAPEATAAAEARTPAEPTPGHHDREHQVAHTSEDTSCTEHERAATRAAELIQRATGLKPTTPVLAGIGRRRSSDDEDGVGAVSMGALRTAVGSNIGRIGIHQMATEQQVEAAAWTVEQQMLGLLSSDEEAEAEAGEHERRAEARAHLDAPEAQWEFESLEEGLASAQELIARKTGLRLQPARQRAKEPSERERGSPRGGQHAGGSDGSPPSPQQKDVALHRCIAPAGATVTVCCIAVLAWRAVRARCGGQNCSG